MQKERDNVPNLHSSRMKEVPEMIPGFTVFCWTLAAFMFGTLF